MDIEKLIERLNIDAEDWAGDHHIKVDLTDAAIALSKFQTAQQLVLDYVNSLNGEVEKLRDELEQVKQEKDAAVKAAQGLDKIVGRAWGEED